MSILYFLGLLSSTFSIVSVYPVFNNTNIILGIFFASFSLICFFFSWRKNNYNNIYSLIWAICIFILTAVLEIVGLWLYIKIFSQWRELQPLSSIFSSIFSLFNVTSGVGIGNVYLNGTAEYVHTFLPGSGNLGLLYFFMFAFGIAPLLSILKPVKKGLIYLGLLIISLLLYLFLRTSALIFLFLAQNVGVYKDTWFSLSLFWHPITSFISFLPWILIAQLISRNIKLDVDLKQNIWSLKKFSKNVFPALLLSISIFLLILFLFWIPSGSEKGGKILFEEYYSDWTKSTKPIDENWYSMASTYNYYTMRIFLNSYYDVTVNENPLDYVDLAQFDVLLIKIPTRPYSEEAIKKIVDYVKNGGSLWVIGDHTNVFGSSTYLNPLLNHFGLKLRHDGIYHNVHGSFNNFYRNNPVNHPIMHKVPVFLFATSCSLQIKNPSIRAVIPGITTKAYRANYANKNFFPDTKPDLNIIYGSNTLMAAGPFGNGRIAVFTDSTVFSNFYMYLPGKPELALSTVTWLNHKQSARFLKPVFLIIAVILFSCFIFFYIKKKASERNLFWPLALSTLCLIISLPIVNTINQMSFKLPEEKRPLTKVSFIGKYSNIYLPFKEWRKEDPNDFNTFYIWGQRVGLRTLYIHDIEEAVKNNSAALFMILPDNRFEIEDFDRIDSYLRKGGKLFILDHGAPGSTSEDLLGQYGLSLKYYDNGKGKVISSQRDFSFTNEVPVGLVEGDCDSLLMWEGEEGESGNIFIKKAVGKGTLYVFGGVLNFSNANFGYSGFVPSGEKKKINDLILEICNLTLKIN